MLSADALLQDAKQRVRDWIAMDAQREHQRNTTTLADYGLTPAMVEERLAGYLQRYAEFLTPARKTSA